MEWFNGAIAIWSACMQARKDWMKENPPAPDKNGKSKKQWYPRTYNPFQFKPVTKDGNHECKLMYQPRKNGNSTDLPITSELRTRRDAFEKKIVHFAPELMAIVYALDNACYPIRRTDIRVRIARHEFHFIDRYWGECNGMPMPTKNPRKARLAQPDALATKLPNFEAANQSDEPVGEKRERRLSRQREF